MPDKSKTNKESLKPSTKTPDEIDDHFFPEDNISKPVVPEAPKVDKHKNSVKTTVDTNLYNPECSGSSKILFTSLQIKFYKTSSTAILPTKNHSDDIGWDVYADEDVEIIQKQSKVVSIGLGLADIDPTIWLEIKMRSGLGFKYDLDVHHGIIDTGYRGEMGVKIRNLGTSPYHIRKGDRIAQLIPRLQIHTSVDWADAPTQTKRGTSGFGSSGK